MTKLEWLSLYNNRLTVVPPQLAKLQNLQWLYLTDNQLTSIPEEFGGFRKLKELYNSSLSRFLRNNSIVSIPEKLRQLPNLTIIN